ncbi:alpha/beta hydrolase [Crossiella sp. NPDC003009]
MAGVAGVSGWREMPKKFLLGAVSAAVVLTGVTVPPASAGGTLVWQDCPGGDGGAQCATVAVPLDWSQPDGRKTHVAISRRKAKDPGRRIGVLVTNPGGPGGSGVLMVAGGSPFTAAVHERFDVVGFDPRGVNAAEQVRCDEALTDRAYEARHPKNQAEFDNWVALNRRQAADCRAHTGALIDHVGNLNAVRDLDAVRAALGERQLSYLGYSYATLLGQQYAERFPHRVRAMVNDGNMDHSLRSTYEFMRTLTAPVERNFAKFARWCDRTAGCALHGRGTAKVYGELREKAKAGTLFYPGSTTRFDFYDMTTQLYFYLNTPKDWHFLATELKRFQDGGPAAPRPATEPVNRPAPAIWCSDWRLPIKDFAEYQALLGRLGQEFPNVGWSPQIDLFAACVGNPLTTTNPQRPLRDRGAPPLVSIGTAHDAQTPHEWSRTAAAQSGSHLVTYQGWGHTIYSDAGASACVNQAVDAYLIDLTVPGRGLSCPATEQPG